MGRLLFPKSDRTLQVGRPERENRVGRDGDARYGQVEGHRSRKARCQERMIGITCVKKAESSPEFHSSGGTGGCETCSCKDVQAAMMEVTRPTIWKEKCKAKLGPYARTLVLLYVIAHRKQIRNEAEACAAGASLDPCSEPVVDYAIASWTKDIEVQRFCRGTTRKGLKRLYYRRMLRENEVLNFPLLKKLELVAQYMLGPRAASAGDRPREAKQWASSAGLERKVGYFKRRGNRLQTREEADSSDSSGGESSPKLGDSMKIKTATARCRIRE